jgi:hypothetical protein
MTAGSFDIRPCTVPYCLVHIAGAAQYPQKPAWAPTCTVTLIGSWRQQHGPPTRRCCLTRQECPPSVLMPRSMFRRMKLALSARHAVRSELPWCPRHAPPERYFHLAAHVSVDSERECAGSCPTSRSRATLAPNASAGVAKHPLGRACRLVYKSTCPKPRTRDLRQFIESGLVQLPMMWSGKTWNNIASVGADLRVGPGAWAHP